MFATMLPIGLWRARGCSLRARSRAKQIWGFIAAALILLCSLSSFGFLILLLGPWRVGPWDKTETHQWLVEKAAWRGFSSILIAPMAAVFVYKSGTKYLREVARYLVCAWLGELGNCGQFLLRLYGWDDVFVMLLTVLGNVGVASSICLVFRLQIELILGFRRSILIPLGEQRLLQTLKILGLVFAMYLPFAALASSGHLSLGQASFPTLGLSFFTLLLIMMEVLQISLGMRSLSKVLHLATHALKEASEATEAAEAARLKEGHRAIRLQYMRLAGTWPCTILVQVLFVMLKGWLWPIPAAGLHFVEENMLMAILQATMCLLAVWGSDGLQGALANSDVKYRAELDRLERREASVQSYKADGDEGWQEKVEEMGLRGFTLAALLDFYRGLGVDYMLHFDPALHTTTDVVREAIIPLSARPQQQALAVQMMQGIPTRPSKMITHNWGNLFTDLVAVTVADALGEFSYGNVASLLRHNPEQIDKWLEASGQSQATVWICAFSVNQHLGICDTNMNDGRDTVTHVQYPLCRCGSRKFMNDSDPCRDDGSSILCEMNKFDDMMAWLAATDSKFHQVIAVDREFQLFSRAWCVAEIAEASVFGMEQRLLVASAGHLERHTPKLKDLRVENMKASRPEDVEIILAKIPDKDEFNQRLQSLIFDRLLTQWNVLDIAEKLSLAGHMARWKTVAQGLDLRMDSVLSDRPPTRQSTPRLDSPKHSQLFECTL